MSPPAVTALVLVALVAAASIWVLQDARARVDEHRPVVAVLLGVTIDQPQTWAVLCLFASVLFLPMYLVARRADG